jgi:hypothetical protein
VNVFGHWWIQLGVSPSHYRMYTLESCSVEVSNTDSGRTISPAQSDSLISMHRRAILRLERTLVLGPNHRIVSAIMFEAPSL